MGLGLVVACAWPPELHNGDGAPSATTAETADSGAPDRQVLDPCEAPSVELGEGTYDHRRLRDGDAVVMVHGPQGGWHIDLSFESTGLGQTVRLESRVVRRDQEVQVGGEQPASVVSLATTDSCALRYVGLRVFLDDVEAIDQAYICGMDQVELDLWLGVTDVRTEVTAEASVRAVAQLDPLDRDGECP